MKGKLEFLSGAAIKGWFVAHGEKVAFGLAALVFVFMLYYAVKRDTLPPEKEPPRLSAAARAADDHVRESQWELSDEFKKMEPPVYVERAKWDPLKVADYAPRTPFAPPIAELKGKRDDPKLFAAEELRASPGYGLLALSGGEKKEGAAVDGDPALAQRAQAGPRNGPQAGVKAHGDCKPAGRYWAVVTGLIPVKKQLGEYQKAFERAQLANPTADVPTYKGYRIERAEVVDGKADKLEWKPLSLLAARSFIQQWAMEAPEVVAPAFVDPLFTVGLPPLLGEDWTEVVAHRPKIPLANTAEETQAAPVAPVEEQPKEDEEFIGGIGRKPKKPGLDPEQPRPAPRTNEKQPEKLGDYKLFRFFDFNVEPGKQYCYRIQLGLENPNKGVAPKFLKNPQNAATAVLPSPVSAPSPVVTIPRAEQILAGPTLKRPASSEPVATIMLTTFDLARGLKAATTEQVMRGNVTTYDRSVEVIDPIAGVAKKQDNVKFMANAIVLDIRGGRPLTGRDSKLFEPTEVLLFDVDGNIVTGGNELLARSELEDYSEFKARDLSGAGGSGPEKPGKKTPAATDNNIFGQPVNEAQPAKPIFKPKK